MLFINYNPVVISNMNIKFYTNNIIIIQSDVTINSLAVTSNIFCGMLAVSLNVRNTRKCTEIKNINVLID